MITYRALGRMGRLGNALFELAATIGVAMDRHEEVMFPADWVHRPYFSIPDELFGDVPDSAVESTEYAQHIDYRVRPYLQDVNLFLPYMDLIRDYLQPSPAAIETLSMFELPERGRLAIHARRGDKVIDPVVPNAQDYHRCATVDYYTRAGALFIEWLDLPREPPIKSLCVFSDDVQWCRENLPPADFYGDGTPYWKEHEEMFGKEAPTDWIDLFLLSRCDYFVVTGSTFGIWGALLSNAAPDHVIRPDRVYGPLLNFINESILFHPNWRAISC